MEMVMKIIVPLAEGFEEIEAITIIDVLRRAKLNVTTVYLDKNPVKGSHDILVTADKAIHEIKSGDFDTIVLPGGMPGSKNLKGNSKVISIIKDIHSKGGYVSAICAAPIVLEEAGVLKGKKATCFPGYEKELSIEKYLPESVVVDGNIITGKGPGSAIPFSLKLVELFTNSETAEQLKNSLQVYWM